MNLRIFAAGFLIFSSLMGQATAGEDGKNRKCLYINSYHKGYDWSDGVAEGLYKALASGCEVTTFYLDAKHAPEAVKQKALEAKNLIETIHPDIVIVSDDNAVKEVLTPYYKDGKIPFVFCGVNWTTKTHNLPYTNATGMIEISPVRALVVEAKKLLKKAKRAVYLSGDVSADRENYEIFKDIYKKEGIELQATFVKSMKEWERGYAEAQSADLILVANQAGIKDWNAEAAQQILRRLSKKLTATNHDYMTKFAVLSLTKIPQEQGEWAAKVALEIMNGAKPSEIPVATNRHWNIYVNAELAKLTHTKIPEDLNKKAIKVGL